MSLSSIQLDAFLAVARTRHFSQAAKLLHITQSALSQRILNLEDELGAALFIRDAGGARLTEAGNKLLAYCRMREGLESELLEELRDDGASLAGVVRVGAYSSVLRSVVMPALQSIIQRHPRVQLECASREMRELPRLLRGGEIDFAVIDHELDGGGFDAHLLGHEESVLVESVSAKARSDVYLDHDAEDPTTADFMKKNGQTRLKLRRTFLDDIYGILDGVEAGWGRAVVPRHLLQGRKGLRLVRGFEPVKSPVVLHYPSQPYYTRLQKAVIEALNQGCPPRLKR